MYEKLKKACCCSKPGGSGKYDTKPWWLIIKCEIGHHFSSHLILKVRKAVGALTVLETTDQPTKCLMHLIVYQCILGVCVYITICTEEVYILIYTPLLYVNYSTSIRYSWIINDCKLILGYMCGNATRDKWKPTSVKYVTSETVALPAYTNIPNIKWLLIDLKIVQLLMLQTQHTSVAEGVCNNYRSPSHAYL